MLKILTCMKILSFLRFEASLTGFHPSGNDFVHPLQRLILEKRMMCPSRKNVGILDNIIRLRSDSRKLAVYWLPGVASRPTD